MSRVPKNLQELMKAITGVRGFDRVVEKVLEAKPRLLMQGRKAPCWARRERSIDLSPYILLDCARGFILVMMSTALMEPHYVRVKCIDDLI